MYRSMHWAGGMCIPACTGQGGVSLHALDREVYPSMHWTGRCAWGVSAQEGVCLGISAWEGCLPGGVCLGGCLPRKGVYQRGVCLGGMSAWGCLPGGVCPGGVCRSACWNTPPPVNRITDACENITLRNYVADGKYFIVFLLSYVINSNVSKDLRIRIPKMKLNLKCVL